MWTQIIAIWVSDKEIRDSNRDLNKKKTVTKLIVTA